MPEPITRVAAYNDPDWMHQLPEVVSRAPEELLRGFVPTRRFARVSFEGYEPDPRYPSQQAALVRMREFATAVAPPPRSFGFWRRGSTNGGTRAMYLDGGFGVGKTHLLAATYNGTPDATRFYLSFAELAYTISRLGLQQALNAFAPARVLCIDEFELDDVAQTRMASMFLRQLLEGPRVRVVTTSNTLPSDLGRGRFAADTFQREIGEIASAFEVITIDGEDYRHRHWDELAGPRLLDSSALYARFQAEPIAAAVLVTWPALAAELERIHPVHYGQIASRLDALYLDQLSIIEDQAVALRLVHFVDKLYDNEVRLAIASAVPLSEVFSKGYRHGGYEKKYRRCLSRLHELLAETEHQLPVGERIQLG
jgi:cell division protein ZapE